MEKEDKEKKSCAYLVGRSFGHFLVYGVVVLAVYVLGWFTYRFGREHPPPPQRYVEVGEGVPIDDEFFLFLWTEKYHVLDGTDAASLCDFFGDDCVGYSVRGQGDLVALVFRDTSKIERSVPKEKAILTWVSTEFIHGGTPSHRIASVAAGLGWEGWTAYVKASSGKGWFRSKRLSVAFLRKKD